MKTNNLIPVWAWRGGVILLCGAALVTLVLLAATLAGIADPRPLGVLTVDDVFTDAHQWRLSADDSNNAAPSLVEGHYQVSVRAGDGQLIGVSPDDIVCPCTIELQGTQTGGEPDAKYGLWWGNAGHQPAILAGVNSDGYQGIQPGDSESGTPVRGWQVFPHVRRLGQVNVFRADIDGYQVTVRLNDEVAAQFSWNSQGRISAGFFVQASPQGDSVFQFLSFKAWEPAPGHP